MDLRLDPVLAASYTSRAQIARVVTETWVREQLYCPACDNDNLEPTPVGTKVVDFSCDSCEEIFQLKSQSRPFGSKVTDAAFGPMVERITSSSAPSFLFLHYMADRWCEICSSSLGSSCPIRSSSGDVLWGLRPGVQAGWAATFSFHLYPSTLGFLPFKLGPLCLKKRFAMRGADLTS